MNTSAEMNSTNVESIFMYFYYCFLLPSSNYHLFAFVLVNVPLVLPLCLYILVLGAWQWRGGAKFSHTDVFTYNVVLVQLLGVSGCCLLILNRFFQSDAVLALSIYSLFLTYSIIVVFQVFTCVERYLAVVHPVTYLRLKSRSWTRIRNLVCALVWLTTITQSVLFPRMQDFEGFFSLSLLFLLSGLLIALFCNICVLRALNRPQPGGGAKGNASKQKAFHTITAITAVLFVKFSGDTFATLSFLLLARSAETEKAYDESCGLYFSILWFTLPSTLVLPLLFLHRKEKLLCCKTKK